MHGGYPTEGTDHTARIQRCWAFASVAPELHIGELVAAKAPKRSHQTVGWSENAFVVTDAQPNDATKTARVLEFFGTFQRKRGDRSELLMGEIPARIVFEVGVLAWSGTVSA